MSSAILTRRVEDRHASESRSRIPSPAPVSLACTHTRPDSHHQRLRVYSVGNANVNLAFIVYSWTTNRVNIGMYAYVDCMVHFKFTVMSTIVNYVLYKVVL